MKTREVSGEQISPLGPAQLLLECVGPEEEGGMLQGGWGLCAHTLGSEDISWPKPTQCKVFCSEVSLEPGSFSKTCPRAEFPLTPGVSTAKVTEAIYPRVVSSAGRLMLSLCTSLIAPNTAFASKFSSPGICFFQRGFRRAHIHLLLRGCWPIQSGGARPVELTGVLGPCKCFPLAPCTS